MPTHRTRSLAALCVGVLIATLTAGCAKGGEDAPSAAPSSPVGSSTTSAPTTATPADTVPADIRAVMDALYAGGTVAATPQVTKALAGRSTAKLAPGSLVAGPTGTWRGTEVAAVKVKEDVTLLVKGASGWQVVGGWWPGLKVAGPVLGGKRFVALLGVDARPGEKDTETRADALQVVGYDGAKGAGILGVARDTWVTLPSGRRSKINAAMTEGGPKGMVGALQKQVGITIAGYLYTDFSGFTGLVDDVGGVEVDVPQDIDTGTSVGVIKAGKQKLDGKKALAFARTRKSLAHGDFDRSGNQGLVLVGGALMAKAGGPVGLPAFLSTIGKHVQSDLDAAEALTFFALPYALDLGTVGRGVSKGQITTSPDGQSIVVAGPAEQKLYADFRDGALAP